MCISKIMLWDMNHSMSFVEGIQAVETNKTDENHVYLIPINFCVHNGVQYIVVWYPCTTA